MQHSHCMLTLTNTWWADQTMAVKHPLKRCACPSCLKYASFHNHSARGNMQLTKRVKSVVVVTWHDHFLPPTPCLLEAAGGMWQQVHQTLLLCSPKPRQQHADMHNRMQARSRSKGTAMVAWEPQLCKQCVHLHQDAKVVTTSLSCQ